MESLQLELVNLFMGVLVALVGVVSRKLVSFLNEKGAVAKLEKNKEHVKVVVNAIEQTYHNLKGEEKLNVAKIELVKLMQEKGIKISEREIDLLIEAMVKEMKDSTKEELGK
ncbi:holin [Bacillus phage vB_BcoS-136]|uniref:Holin n=1 Tax=Bacillus phage vB_BcoS-136 TaxID=2419619 RepID=A0A3G3BVI3_9CAUD|nr:holin [Bacillus phage vB_BcoS-136]AYP68269.1 holin [Bacillus phage vB_BcoS-136]